VERCLVKQIKLRDNPSADDLEKQLGVINQKFSYIISSYKSFNLKLEKTVSGNHAKGKR
jgi:hypothetical protein